MSRTSVWVVALLMSVGLSLAVQVQVSIVDFSFSPDSVNINASDSVMWTNNGTYVHTSTSGVNGAWDSLWDSGDMVHGVTFVHGFPVGGAFHYFCRHHYSGGMKGVVVVAATGVNETPGTGRNVEDIASFPNPFRASTSIRFAPAVAGRGSIRVFDASGKFVRTLPAVHAASVTWDGKDGQGQETGPGVYFCRYGSAALTVTRLR